MNGGIINCECGQQQYVETVNVVINCITCGELHNVYPILEAIEEGVEDGTDI